MIIITLIKLFLLCWVLTRFEPISWLLELLPDNLVFNITKAIITCLKCSLLWVTFLHTGDIFVACGMSFFGFWYDKIIGYYENRIKL
jgi:hypothetical protein